MSPVNTANGCTVITTLSAPAPTPVYTRGTEIGVGGVPPPVTGVPTTAMGPPRKTVSPTASISASVAVNGSAEVKTATVRLRLMIESVGETFTSVSSAGVGEPGRNRRTRILVMGTMPAAAD